MRTQESVRERERVVRIRIGGEGRKGGMKRGSDRR